MEKTRFFACFVRMFNAMCFAICAVLFSLDAYSNCTTGYREQTSPFSSMDYHAGVKGYAYRNVITGTTYTTSDYIGPEDVPTGKWNSYFNYVDVSANINMHGVLLGRTYCASEFGQGGYDNIGTFSVADDVYQAESGKNCWCQAYGFIPTGEEEISFSGKWVRSTTSMYNQETCENNECAVSCANLVNSDSAFRQALFTVPQCTANSPEMYSITYNNTISATWENEQNHPASYTAGDTVELGRPTREGYAFVAWCDDEDLQTNCSSTKTISSSDTGDKTFYAKWNTLPCEAGRQNQTSPFTENDYKAPGIAYAYFDTANGQPALATYRGRDSEVNITLDNTLDALPAGRYEIFFSDDTINFHGMMYGKAQCSTTPGYTGSWLEEGHGQSVPKDISDVSGNYCWCQLDGYVPYTNSNSQWVPNGERVNFLTKWLSPGGSTCTLYSCAKFCVEKLRAQLMDRKALYGPDTIPSCATKTYTITYELDGGEWLVLTNKPETYTIASSTITLPTPVRDEYNFTGWVDNFGNQITQIETGSYGNITLYAQWETNAPETYSITYNNMLNATWENGQNHPASYTAGDTVELGAPTREGYVFVAWCDDEDLQTNCSSTKTISSSDTGNKTFYAKWNTATCDAGYEIQTSPFGDTDYIASMNGYSYVDVNSNNEFYIKTNQGTTNAILGTSLQDLPLGRFEIFMHYYGFSGMFYGYAKCSSTLKEKQGFYEIKDSIDENTSGQYCWCQLDGFTSYNISGSNSNNVIPSGERVDIETKWFSPSVSGPCSRGINSCAWACLDEIGGTPHVRQSLYGPGSLPGCMIKTYTITYELDGGEWLALTGKPETYTITSATITLPTPTREGYTFEGWLDNQGNSVSTIPTGSYGNKVFYASWQDNSPQPEEPLSCQTGYVNQEISDCDLSGLDVSKEFLMANGQRQNGYHAIDGSVNVGGTYYTMNADELERGEWYNDFEYGRVKGRAFCSNFAANNDTNQTWERESSYWTGSDAAVTSATGKYCWCKITGFTSNSLQCDNINSVWAYVGKHSSSCAIECAWECATYFGWSDSGGHGYPSRLRQALYSSVTNSTHEVCIPIPYTITYELDNGEWPIALTGKPETYTITSATITLPTPTREGYTFEGWLDNQGNSVSTIPTGSYGNKVFYASWQEDSAPTQTYTVTFDLGDNGTNQATYNVGETITLPEQTKDDYAFVGYCVNSSNCSADLRVKQLNYAEIPENPITLYPQFIKVATVQEPEKCLNYNGCSVIIDLGNGDEIEQTFSEDTDLVLPAQESTSNTVFNGYCENSATCVDPVMNLTYEQATGNSVFYPQYIATSAEEIPTIEDRTCASETCSVIINIPVVAPTRGIRGLRLFRSASANTYNETTVKTFNEGDLMVLPLPTKTDSTLSGYCIGEEDSCGNPVMTITNDDLDVNENSVTITPVFTEKTIISCPEDYPELDENDQCYNSWTCPETPICPTHSNTCIYTGATSGRDYYGQPSSALCEISFTCDLGYENTTNSAVCTPIEYDIQYVIPDGDFLSTLNNDSIPRKYTVESVIDLSGITAARSGYTFEGWYDNENLNGSALTTLSNLQTGGITLYAKFEPIVCTVVYHDGDAETQETYTAQATIDLTQLSAKVRYTFEGWCEDLDNCPEPKNTLTASNGTINLYAKWARIVCQDGEYFRYTECLSCPSGYPYSNGATATEATQCYRTSTCNNSPVCPGNATDCELAANGEIVEYYGDAMPYCQETFSCRTGYTPQINLLSGANILTASDRVGFANRNGDGQNMSYQPLMPTLNTWFNTFTYGTVYGRALCSAKSGADYNNYQWNTENPGLTSTEAELSAAGEGQYCWCQINGFSPENTYTQNMSSPWMMEANLSNTNNCFSNCSKYCSYAISGIGTGLVNLANNRKYRAALYDSATLVQGTSSTSSAAGKTWSVTFPYGEVSGISLCSPYSGTHSSASNPVVFDAPVPEDSHQVQYCWCKATNVALNDNNSLEYMLTDVWNNPFGMSNCNSHCAETCAKSIKEDWSTRNQLFRVWAKKQACVPEQYAIMYHNVDMDDVVWSNDSLKPSVYTILDADVTIGRPSRTAYSFYGWCSSAEDANDPDSVCPDTVTINTGSSGTVNLYAKWGPKRYSITYMDNETPLNLLVPYSYIEAELPVDLPTTAYSSNDDFVFDGWYNNPGFLGDAFTKIDAGSRTNRTFYAKWRPKYYTITYKDGENLLDNIEPILTPSSNEETISLPSLEDRDGLTFIGWCDDAELTNNCSITKTVSANTPITVYAKWDKAVYTITYLDNDTDEVISGVEPDTYTVDDAVDLPQNIDKVHYNFQNLIDEENNNITEIQQGSTGNRTLRAAFAPKAYTISFEPDVLSNETPNSIGYTVETLPLLPIPATVRTGYVFEGYLNTNTQEIISEITQENAGDMTLSASYSYTACGEGYTTQISDKAVWNTNKNPKNAASYYYKTNDGAKAKQQQGTTLPYGTWLVLFNPGSLSGSAACSSVSGELPPDVMSASTEAQDLQRFALGTTGRYCWCMLDSYNLTNTSSDKVLTRDSRWVYLGDLETDYTCVHGTENSGLVSCAARCAREVNENKRFRAQILNEYAICTVGIYDIITEPNGGTFGNQTVPDKTSMFYHDITLPEPEKNGYTFAGWCDDSALTENCETTKIIPTGTGRDVRVYAAWTPVNYNIIYNTNEGSLPEDVSNVYHIDDTVELPSPTKDDYVFAGWYECANFECDSVSGWGPNEEQGSKEFWAKWEPLSYTITYNLRGGEFNNNESNSQNYTIEDNTITLKTPTKLGYTFLGWCVDDEDCEENMVTGEQTGWSGNKTLFANWALDRYSINYENIDGADWDKDTVALTEYTIIDNYAIMLPTPLKTGHVFDGWYTTNNLDEDLDSPAPVTKIEYGTTGSKTFYAKWNCIAGYYLHDNTCDICPAGSYSNAGDTQCTLCSDGYTSNEGASVCETCLNYTDSVSNWEQPAWNNDYSAVLNTCEIQSCTAPGYQQVTLFDPLIAPMVAYSNVSNPETSAPTCRQGRRKIQNCPELSLYNWETTYTYGTVKGVSECIAKNDTSVATEEELNNYNPGNSCWCKINNFTPFGGSTQNTSYSQWVNAGTSYTDINACRADCATACAMPEQNLRELLFNTTFGNNDLDICAVIKYDIIYNGVEETDWSEDAARPDFYTSLQEIINIGQPNRSGYVFEGWCETADCKDPETQESMTPELNYSFNSSDREGTVNLYAQWSCATGYYKDGDSCTMCPTDQYGIQYTSPNKNTDNINSCYYSCADVFEVFCPEHSIDCLYAGDSNATNSYGYETNNCTISFNCDPGYGVDGALCSLNTYYITYVDTLEDIASENHETSESYTVNDLPVSKSVSPENTHTGYDFDGWCETDELTGDCLTTITIDVNTIGDKTFYARWTAQNYTITYHNNGVDSEDSYTYGIEKNLNAPETPTGYVFAGWYTNSDFSGEAVQTIADTETDDKEFWAKWTCTANYYHDSNTCTACPDLYPTSVVNDNEGIGKCYAQCETITECPEHATCSYANTIDDKDYYKENATETCVSGIECDTGYGLENGACVLQTYTVTFMDGETQLRQESYTINSVEPIVSTKPGNSGGEFAGWCDNEDLTGECPTTVTVQPSDASDKTFYAKWSCGNGYYGSACTQCPEGYRNTDAGAARITDCYNEYTCPTECPPHAVSCTQPTQATVKNYYGSNDTQTCDMDVVCEDGYEAKTIDKINTNKITYAKYLNGDSYKTLGKQTFGFFASYYNTPEAITETSHLSNGETEQFFDYGSVRMVSRCDTATTNATTINNEPGSNCWCKFTQYSPDGTNYTNLDFPWKPGLPWQTYEQCLNSCSCDGVPDSWWRNQKVCSARAYTIYFELNGGYIETNNDYMLYDVTADPFDLPKPTRPGYDFAGWCNNENLTGECPITVTIQPSDAENKTFYAKWTPVVCGEGMVVATRFNTTKEPIAFSSIEIDGVIRTTEMSYPGRLPNAYGLTESGTWATEYDYGTLYGEAACKDAQYYMGAYKASSVPDEVFNTFADTPFVTIDTDGSVFATCYCKPTAFKPTFGSKQALSNNWKEYVYTSAYECNTHCAYYCSQDKSRATIHLLGEFTNTNYCAYTITYNLNQGDFPALAVRPDYYDTGDTINIAEPMRSGYAFAGWCVGTDNCSNPQKNFTISPETVGSIDLRAQWTANQYTITYDTKGGTPSYQSENYTVGNIVYLPGPPSKSGYDFAGWCPDDENCAEPITTITWSGWTEDVTLYAVWLKTYQITYVFDNGTPNKVEKHYVGETVTFPSAPTKSGFSFAGWCVDTNCETPLTGTTHSGWENNITLTAKWVENTPEEFVCASNAWLHVGEDKACLATTYFEKPILVIKGKKGTYYLKATRNSDLPMSKDTTKQLRMNLKGTVYNIHDESVSGNNDDNSSNYDDENNSNSNNETVYNITSLKQADTSIKGTGLAYLQTIRGNHGYSGARRSDYGLTAAGDWGVTFPYGKVVGTSLCSSTSGTYAMPGYPNETNDIVNTNCWCKLTRFIPNTGSQQNITSSQWIFRDAVSFCPDCAGRCANMLRDYSTDPQKAIDFRTSLFNNY